MLLKLVVFLYFISYDTACALSDYDSWNHQRIQLQDVSIHFRYFGSGPSVLLVHGFPQHSVCLTYASPDHIVKRTADPFMQLTWHTIGPILAQNYTVIAPDNRGSGASSLSATGNYTAAAGGEDLAAILDFLNINQTFVIAHDKGVGLATALALNHPSRISGLALIEYVLPGFGYQTTVTGPDLYQNWQLAFFAVPDAAEYFISGREKHMLAWYFWHASYSGTSVISQDHLDRYTTDIGKPGFLRAGMQYFAAAWADAEFFTARFNMTRLEMPVLVMGGEASGGFVLRVGFENLAVDLRNQTIPKAGHWIGEDTEPVLFMVAFLMVVQVMRIQCGQVITS